AEAPAEHARDESLVDDVGRLAEHLRRGDGEHDADGAEERHQHEPPGGGLEHPDHAPEAGPEVVGLARCRAVPHAAALEARLLGELGFFLLSGGHLDLLRALPAHASTPSCDSTISRYVGLATSSSSCL